MTGIGIPLQRNRSPGPVRFQPLAKGAYPGEERRRLYPLTAFLFKALHGYHRKLLVDAGPHIIGLQGAAVRFFLERFIRIGIGQFNIGYYAFPLRGASVHPVEFLFGHFHKIEIGFVAGRCERIHRQYDLCRALAIGWSAHNERPVVIL